MTENNEKIPKLRFPGYTDAWEQRKLIDVAQFNPKTVLPDEFEYVDLESVIGTEMISHRTESKDQAPSRAQRLAKKGDVFYQTVRPYQMNNYLYDLPYDNYVFSTGYAQMRPNIDSYFLLNSVQNKQFVQHVLDRSTGTSYPAINSSDLSNIEINVPSKLAEQKKIGSFFKQVDNTIALHQRKLSDVKKLKAGLLQKMFPKNGEDVPEVRFLEYTDAWEQRKLKELADFSKGLGYTKSDLTESGNPIILYGRLYTKYQTVIDNVDTFVDVKDKSVVSIGGEVIVPSSGESSEDIARASVVDNAGVILGGDLNVIKPKDEIDSTFLALTISNGQQRKELSKRAQGKSVVHLHNSDLKEVNLIFPSIDEQKQIGELFKGIENTIALHQRKLENLQKLKKALLQQMFV